VRPKEWYRAAFGAHVFAVTMSPPTAAATGHRLGRRNAESKRAPVDAGARFCHAVLNGVYSAAAGFTSAFAGAGAECLAEISTTSMQITVKMAEV
jgi:hypothetical protein